MVEHYGSGHELSVQEREFFLERKKAWGDRPPADKKWIRKHYKNLPYHQKQLHNKCLTLHGFSPFTGPGDVPKAGPDTKRFTKNSQVYLDFVALVDRKDWLRQTEAGKDPKLPRDDGDLEHFIAQNGLTRNQVLTKFRDLRNEKKKEVAIEDTPTYKNLFSSVNVVSTLEEVKKIRKVEDLLGDFELNLETFFEEGMWEELVRRTIKNLITCIGNVDANRKNLKKRSKDFGFKQLALKVEITEHFLYHYTSSERDFVGEGAREEDVEEAEKEDESPSPETHLSELPTPTRATLLSKRGREEYDKKNEMKASSTPAWVDGRRVGGGAPPEAGFRMN